MRSVIYSKYIYSKSVFSDVPRVLFKLLFCCCNGTYGRTPGSCIIDPVPPTMRAVPNRSQNWSLVLVPDSFIISVNFGFEKTERLRLQTFLGGVSAWTTGVLGVVTVVLSAFRGFGRRRLLVVPSSDDVIIDDVRRNWCKTSELGR